MKYGILYYKSTDNLGDDIQTYAAIKYLPHIDYYIDREHLSCFVPKEKEYVSMIMNGWYIHNKIAWPPSPYIYPLLISMHFKESEEYDVGDSYLKDQGGEFLNKYGPVGARDFETKKRLEKNGIQSYLSGCLTLTIEKFKDIIKKDNICVVDLEKSIIDKIKENTESKIEIISHQLDPKESEKKTFKERMNEVENVLKKYQESRLVITSRLHVLLPCIALEVPVIFLHKKSFDKDRLEMFLNWVDSYEEEEFLNQDIKEILKNPKENSLDYIKMKCYLDNMCKQFILKCENLSTLDLGVLPDIEKYQDYANNIKWYISIYEKERQALEKISKKRVEQFDRYCLQNKKLYQEIQELLESYKNLKLNLRKLEIKNQSLSEELSSVYNSKGWKYLEMVRKVFNE